MKQSVRIKKMIEAIVAQFPPEPEGRDEAFSQFEIALDAFNKAISKDPNGGMAVEELFDKLVQQQKEYYLREYKVKKELDAKTPERVQHAAKELADNFRGRISFEIEMNGFMWEDERTGEIDYPGHISAYKEHSGGPFTPDRDFFEYRNAYYVACWIRGYAYKEAEFEIPEIARSVINKLEKLDSYAKNGLNVSILDPILTPEGKGKIIDMLEEAGVIQLNRPAITSGKGTPLFALIRFLHPGFGQPGRYLKRKEETHASLLAAFNAFLGTDYKKVKAEKGSKAAEAIIDRLKSRF